MCVATGNQLSEGGGGEGGGAQLHHGIETWPLFFFPLPFSFSSLREATRLLPCTDTCTRSHAHFAKSSIHKRGEQSKQHDGQLQEKYNFYHLQLCVACLLRFKLVLFKAEFSLRCIFLKARKVDLNLITCEARAIMRWSSYINTKSINCFASEIKIAGRILQWVPNLKPRYRKMSLCEFGPKMFALVLCAQMCASAIWWWSLSWQLYGTFIMVNCLYWCVRSNFGCRIYVLHMLHSTWSVLCFIIFLFVYVPFVAYSVLHLCYLQ